MSCDSECVNQITIGPEKLFKFLTCEAGPTIISGRLNLRKALLIVTICNYDH